MSVAFTSFDRQRHQEKLRAMSDAELVKTGRMLRELARNSRLVVDANGHDDDAKWDAHLEDAIAEWRRRRLGTDQER